MICQDCKEAGKLRISVAGALAMKRMLHNRCKGGTHCTCQHRIVRKNIV